MGFKPCDEPISATMPLGMAVLAAAYQLCGRQDLVIIDVPFGNYELAFPRTKAAKQFMDLLKDHPDRAQILECALENATNEHSGKHMPVTKLPDGTMTWAIHSRHSNDKEVKYPLPHHPSHKPWELVVKEAAVTALA